MSITKEQLIELKNSTENNLTTLVNSNLLKNMIDELLKSDTLSSSDDEDENNSDSYAIICYTDDWIENTETCSSKEEAFENAQEFMTDYDHVKVYRLIAKTQNVFKEI